MTRQVSRVSSSGLSHSQVFLLAMHDISKRDETQATDIARIERSICRYIVGVLSMNWRRQLGRG